MVTKIRTPVILATPSRNPLWVHHEHPGTTVDYFLEGEGKWATGGPVVARAAAKIGDNCVDIERERRFFYLLDAALDRDPAERPSFLVNACRDDRVLLRMVTDGLEMAVSLDMEDTSDARFAATIKNQVYQVLHIEPETDERDVLVGRHLSHYHILEFLGQGGMGVVYKARDTRLNRDVALKIVPDKINTGPELLRRLRHEGKAIAALSHPNIVTVYSIEEAEEMVFLTMELVDGRTLAEVIPKQGMGQHTFLQLAIPLVDALCSAHARGIIHRDLKPDNIMITNDGRVKILDFGLAKLHETTALPHEPDFTPTALTKTGRVMGSFPYMSPEQARGKNVNHLSDIFSLGIIFYEMATGRRPFKGETRSDLISAILRDSPDHITEMNPAFSPRLTRLIHNCLEKNPRQRYPSTSNLYSDLTAIKERTTATTTQIGATIALNSLWKRAGWLRWMVPLSLVVLAVFFILRPTRKGKEIPINTESKTMPFTLSPRSSVRLILGDFKNGTPEPNFGFTVKALLHQALNQSGKIIIFPRKDIARYLDSTKPSLEKTGLTPELLTLICIKNNLGIFITGEVDFSNNEYHLTVNIHNLTTVQPKVFTYSFSRAGQLFETVQRLGSELRAFLGEKTLDVKQKPLEEVTTSSMEALERYSEAMAYLEKDALDKATLLLESALEKDEDFALALARLATCRFDLGNLVMAHESARRAFLLRDRLTEREKYLVEGHYHMYRMEYTRARNAWNKLELNYPGDVYVLRQLAHCHGVLDQTAKAVTVILDARNISPANVLNRGMYIIALVEDNRFEEASLEYTYFQKHFPDNPYPHWGGGLALLGRGAPDHARGAFKALSMGGGIYRSWGDLLIAKTLIFEGKFDGAEKKLQISMARDKRSDRHKNYTTGALYLAAIYHLTGQRDNALELLNGIHDLELLPGHIRMLHNIGLLYADLKAIPELTLIENKLQKINEGYPSKMSQGALFHLQGEHHRVEGRLDEAESFLHNALGSWYDAKILWSLARVLEQQQNFGQAADWYKEITTKNTGRILREDFPAFLILAYRGLANCLQETRDMEGAIQALDRFLDHWGMHAQTMDLVAEAIEKRNIMSQN